MTNALIFENYCAFNRRSSLTGKIAKSLIDKTSSWFKTSARIRMDGVFRKYRECEFMFGKGTNAADRRRTGGRNFCGWLNEIFHSW